jgi:hypothetical protein
MLAAASWATGRALKWVVEWKVELEITKMQTIPSAQTFFYHTHKNFCATKQNTKKSKFKRLASNCNAILFFLQLQMFYLATKTPSVGCGYLKF